MSGQTDLSCEPRVRSGFVRNGEKTLWQKLFVHPAILLIPGILLTLDLLYVGLISSIASESYFAVMPVQPADKSSPAGLLIWLTLVVVLFYWAFVRFIERRPFTDLGLKVAGREWLFGVAIGAGAITVIIGIIAAFGGYRILDYNGAEVLIFMGAVAIQSGVVEEILFRGLIFRLMEKWLGSAAALIISAMLFGLAHLANENGSWFASICIAIEAGLLLGAVYMVTRRLWAAIGVHMAWNFTQGGIFGVAVSGHEIPGLIVSAFPGPELLTGGAFGAEASLPALIVATAIGVGLLYVAIKRGEYIRPSKHRFITGEAPPAA